MASVPREFVKMILNGTPQSQKCASTQKRLRTYGLGYGLKHKRLEIFNIE